MSSAAADLIKTAGLNALGALVIGLGTNDRVTSDLRIGMEALANLAGAIHRTTTSTVNGTPDPMDLITDGDRIWVVNDTRLVDKVFRYSVDGTLQGSWQIDDGKQAATFYGHR